MKILSNIRQQSEHWEEIRAGRPTASCFSKIITASTGKLSSQADDYIIALIHESIAKEPNGFHGNRHTERGNELEPDAREMFAKLHPEYEVVEVGFVTRDDGIIGCSPDSLLRDRSTGEFVAGLELKAPESPKWIKQMEADCLPNEHKQQVHGSLSITGFNRWYYCNYSEVYGLHEVVVGPTDYTAKVGKALDDFLIRYSERRKELMPKLLECRANFQQLTKGAA